MCTFLLLLSPPLSHALKAVGAAFLIKCALMQCVGWGCADVYRGLRCEISSEASSVSQIRNHLERSLYLLVYHLCYRKSRLPEHDVQNINQWVRMRLFINGANVQTMQRFLSDSSHLNAKPSKWSQWCKKGVPFDSHVPQSAAKPKVNLMNMELSSMSGLHVLFSKVPTVLYHNWCKQT